MLGVFDSGIGGLTVAKEIKKRHPKIPIVYFGDIARVPWGNKSQKVVCGYASEIVEFLISKGCREIVIACNTASALAGEYLRKKYPKVKFYDVIEPVVGKISREPGSNIKVLVIGTRGTVASGAYENKIKNLKRNIKIYSQACPLFVPLVEEGWTNSEIAESVAKQYLKKYAPGKNARINIGINSVILGCTHYPLLEKMLKKVLGKEVEIISSAEEVAKTINAEEKSKKKDQYYFSDWTQSYQRLAEKILGSKIKINIKKI